MDSNLRKQWEDSIRAFNNQHPTDSKYNMPQFEKRSRLYRPRTRTIIRKHEAAAAAAFFSNMDVVSITPQDQTNKVEAASAAIWKEVLQHRLTKTIPWYLVVLGGLQDAQTVGVAIAHVHWDYEVDQDAEISEPEPPVMGPVAGGVGDQRPKNMDLAQLPPEVAQQLMEKQPSTSTQQPDGQPSTPTVEPDAEYAQQGSEGIPSGSFVATQDGQLRSPEAPQQQEAVAPKRKKPLTDKPVIDLLPVENLRISPSANWMDPINSSPYVIHLMPMYAMDVKAKIDKGEWLPCSDAEILKATEIKADSTRAARNSPRDDPASQDAAGIDDYTIVWVQRHIHKKHGKDWEFYTLADTQLLSDAVPLEEVELHGIRPYVMGVAILETHKTYPTSVPQLNRGLQDEINEVTNQRIDNVKFVLNKKWFVRRGRNADLSGLVRNVPGGVVMLDDPEKDVREINWPDVTASAFQEQNSLTMGRTNARNSTGFRPSGETLTPKRNWLRYWHLASLCKTKH